MAGGRGAARAGRIPHWLKTDLPDARSVARVAARVRALGLNTICFESGCPNQGECFAEGAVTFLLLGRNCTRRCRFCNVNGGAPEPVRPDEPAAILEAVRTFGLGYVILTSVTRDDLPDGGAGHFVECVRALRRDGEVNLEVLTPDFGGNMTEVDRVASSGVEVYSHNIETVCRLYPMVRAGADYHRSLEVLSRVRKAEPGVVVKSGLMLGLGESIEEVKTALQDLSRAGCEVVTAGQYMQPSRAHLPVAEYVRPEAFEEIAEFARSLGLTASCGPRVRSSYRAEEVFTEAVSRR
jgi:lipoic acid synthetase